MMRTRQEDIDVCSVLRWCIP